MKKLIYFLIIALSYLAGNAQIAWPPKSFPTKVPFILPAEIQYYWGIKSIICTGRSNGGYKFKVTGIGNHDHSASQIDMLYMKPAKAGGFPEASIAGTYFFPAAEKGKSFYFDFVAAWPGRTPSKFSLFFKSDWISLPDNPEWEETSPASSKSPKSDKDYGNTGNLANIAPPDLIVDKSNELDKSTASPDYKPRQKEDEIFTQPEVMPEFPGGSAEMYKWVSAHLRYPEAAVQNNIQGRVIVKFVVTKTGEIDNVQIVRGVDKDLDREAIRLVKSMPAFKPGMINGEPVNTYFNFPFTFKLQSSK